MVSKMQATAESQVGGRLALSADRDRIIVRYTLEKVRRWVREFQGPAKDLEKYLVEKIDSYRNRADLLLSDMIDELF